MNTENTKSRNKGMAILIAIIVVMLIAVILLVALLLKKPEPEVMVESGTTSGKLVYETQIVTEDPETLQAAVDAMVQKAKEGQMNLQMQTQAFSKDGKTFTCYLANSLKNNYDMFMVFYLDETQEEIYRTGLIPLGARIEQFTLEEALPKGSHEITIVFNQVEADMETIHAQVNVGLTLVVN